MSRIKGQEVELVLLVDGAPRQNFTFIRSTEMTFLVEIKEEGFLGETTQRYDTIFNGISGKAQAHYDSPEVFNIIRFVVDKARLRVPGTQFNLKMTANFSSGRRARVVVPDISIGEMPLNFGGRAEYGTFDLPYKASIAQVLST